MIMPPLLRKVALTAHITASAGWLGAVGAFLALAVAGLTSQEAQLVHASYLAMEVIAWFVIVPLAFAALLTGLVSSLATAWGVFRNYWVLIKLLITILATIVLLLQLEPISYLAGAAAQMTLSSAVLREARIALVVHAGGGLLVLLVPMALSVYKPRGLTPYGLRKQREQRHKEHTQRTVSQP